MQNFKSEIEISADLMKMGACFRIPVIRISDCKILEENYEISDLINNVNLKLKEQYTEEQIKSSEIVQKYRNFSWHFLKIDPTKNRPSGESLARRLIKANKFPKINPFVDAYNLASAETFISISAYDLQKIEEPLTLRLAHKGERFFAIGNIEKSFEGQEFVISDAQNRVLTQYLYRDSEETKVSSQTQKIIFIVNSVNHLEEKELEFAKDQILFYLNEFSKRGIISFHLSK